MNSARLFAVALSVLTFASCIEEGFAATGSRQLFPAADVKVEPNDGATVRAEGDVAVVDVAPERSFSGAKFVFGKPFAFIDCRTVSVEISNRTDRAMGFGFYGIHRGDYTWHAAQRFRLEPNQSKVVTAAGDRGSLHAGLVPCCDMKDRVEHYKAYVRAALKDRNLVGVHWFFWSDMPLTGWMDGEDFMTGVLTVTDTPHPEMVEATRELARELYPQPAEH